MIRMGSERTISDQKDLVDMGVADVIWHLGQMKERTRTETANYLVPSSQGDPWLQEGKEVLPTKTQSKLTVRKLSTGSRSSALRRCRVDPAHRRRHRNGHKSG